MANQRISLVSGGKLVNGQFVPNTTTSTRPTTTSTATAPKPTASTGTSALSALKSRLMGLRDQYGGSATLGSIQGKMQQAAAPQPMMQQQQPSYSNVDSYYKDLLKQMAPSRDETRLMDQQAALDSELRNLNLGQQTANRNIADQPIALGFITGQQNAVEERYALRRNDVTNRQQTLQAKLANLQARRQAAMDVAKTGLSYAQSQQDRQDRLSQQTLDNNYRSTAYADALKQQTFENSLAQQKANTTATKTNNISGYTSSSVPAGGYDSTQGMNFLKAPTNDVKTRVYSMFPQSFATSLIAGLTDEQLRLFLNDYTETQNIQQQSIDPVTYFAQWKKAAGIGQTTSQRSMWN